MTITRIYDERISAQAGNAQSHRMSIRGTQYVGQRALEKPYENAMVVEFQRQSIPYQQQPRFRVIYKSVNVGESIPDLIAFDSIIVDTKVIQSIGNNEVAQMIN